MTHTNDAVAEYNREVDAILADVEADIAAADAAGDTERSQKLQAQHLAVLIVAQRTLYRMMIPATTTTMPGDNERQPYPW